MRNSYDPTPPTSRFGRARYTPAADVVRGLLSARLDPRTLIAEADLPASVATVIYTVVCRSRLWLREKLDVTRELVAHFQDGLSAGRSADDLIRDFGPADQAARLIRQAKLRNRPWPWQCWRLAVRSLAIAIGTAVLIYALLAARFYLGSPAVDHNYWQDLNAARQVPEPDAAWPIYREAIIKLGGYNDKKAIPRVDVNWIEEGPSGKHWSELEALVERRQDVIKLAREAAKKPRFGFLLSNPQDRTAYQAAQADWLLSTKSDQAAENDELISALLGGIQEMRELARLLQADARVAAVAGDGDRVVADIKALLAMSEHINQPHSFLVEQLISVAIFGLAMQDIGTILTESPDVLSEAQLRELAHRIAAYRGGDITIDFNAEQVMFDDLLQRIYTDNGHGDGRITRAGLVYLMKWNREFSALPKLAHDEEALIQLAGPGLSTIIAGRAETRDFARTYFDETIAGHQGPAWRWDMDKVNAAEDRVRMAAASPVQKVRYWLPLIMLPASTQVCNAAERAIQQRDATEVAIALVLWHRRHGAWPQELDELVPDLLPAVPPDRFDGLPLRNVVRDGQPVVYSLGLDRDDDGGRPTKEQYEAWPGQYGMLFPKQLESYKTPDHDGDWILWPPLPPKPAPPEPTSGIEEEDE